jgi:hypothetical protein
VSRKYLPFQDRPLLNSNSSDNEEHAGLAAFAAGLALDLKPISDRVDQLQSIEDPDELNAGISALISDLPALLAESYKTKNSSAALTSDLNTSFYNGVAKNSGLEPKDNPHDFDSISKDIQDNKVLDSIQPDELDGIGGDISNRADWVSASVKANLAQDLADQLQSILDSQDAPVLDDLDDFSDPSLDDGLGSKPAVGMSFWVAAAMALGFGALIQAGDDVDDYPCQRFVRLEDRKEWRDWPSRYADAGGQFYDEPSTYPEGLMADRIDSDIWYDLNVFGVNYCPMDYKSGMGFEPMSREDAVQLGVIDADEVVEPPDDGFNDNVVFSGDLDQPIKDVLMSALGDDFYIDTESGNITNADGKVKNSKYKRAIQSILNRKETQKQINNCHDYNDKQVEPAWKLMMPRKIKQPFHIANAKPVKSERRAFRVPGRKVLNDDSGSTGSMSSLGSYSSSPMIKRFATRR